MTSRRVFRLSGLLTAVVLVLVLAACGGNGDGEADANGNGVAENPLAEAAAATTDAGTSRLVYDAFFEGTEGSFSFSAEGEVDYGAQRSRFDYDMSNLPGPGGEDVEVRIDWPTVYVRFPEDSRDVQLPEGKDWIRLPPPADPGAAAGFEGDEGATPPLELASIQQDPTQFLRYLRTGATDVQEEGNEEVRGEATTIYTALIDLDQVIEAGGDGLGDTDEQRAAGVRGAEMLRAQLGETPLPVTVNVGEDGLVRRLLLSFDLSAGPAGAVSALTTTELFDFGTEVDVEPPAEEQVIDAADVE